MSFLLRLAIGIVALASCGTAAAKGYATDGLCGGFPKLHLQTPPGLCVGLIAQHLGFARGVVEIGHDIYVLDMGGWRENHGRLLRLGHDGHDAPQTLLTGLNEPNGIAAAPGGALYIALLGSIVRFDPAAPKPALQDIVTGLPTTGRHPLSALAVAPDGALYINVGSATDHCENADGSAPDPKLACRETAANPPRASIVRAVPGSSPLAWPQTRIVATGLRNSLGLAILPGGALVAAVNARDAIDDADPTLSDAALPHDTLDVIEPGADYGWPYCFDDNRPSPEYRRHDCASARRPTLLLPPHAAPLGMLLYSGTELPHLDHHLVMTYHGYRAEGHRVMTLAVDAQGRPIGPPVPLVWGWDGETGKTPQGAPVAVAEMADGTLLITEDHNQTLLRVARAAGGSD